jgi:hypothetical protein
MLPACTDRNPTITRFLKTLRGRCPMSPPRTSTPRGRPPSRAVPPPSKPIQEVQTSSGETLKDVFRNISYSGYHPTPVERSKALVLGLRKSFKTSYACSNPKAAILDWEGGANAVLNPKAHIFNLSNTPVFSPGEPEYEAEQIWLAIPRWDRWLKIKSILLADAKTPDPQFHTVAWDSVDRFTDLMEALFLEEKGKEHMGDYKKKGAGYNELAGRVMAEIDELEEARYGAIYNVHLVEKRIDEGDKTSYVPKVRLYDSIYKELLMRVEQIIQISLLKTKVPKVVERTLPDGRKISSKISVDKVCISLRTMPTPENRERGCRVQIPDGIELPLNGAYAAYAAEYNRQVKENTERLAGETA